MAHVQDENRGMQRSRFVAGGVAAGGAALVGLAAGRPGRSRAATGDDLEALQLLLLIEHTENAFYKAALDRGGLRGELRTYAGTVSGQEREHLDFARRALGAKASPEPRFEFSAAALDPGGFAETAAQLEDLAVAAYNGQATNVSRATFEAVAKIVSVERLAEGEFTCLVVTRLERLAGSASELAALARKLERHGVRLVVTEIDFDSAAGRSRIAARPLAHAHRVEEPNGSRPSRPARAPGTLADHPELRQRIVDMHTSGMTLQAIADTLNDEGIPTVRGGTKWRPSSLYGALGRPRSTGRSPQIRT